MVFATTLNNEYTGSGKTNIIATAVGIYVHTIVNSYACTMKIPLDGNISGAETITYPSGAGSTTVTFNYITSGSSMATGSDISFTYDGTHSVPLTASAYGSNTGGTPSSGNTPVTSTSTF